MKNKKKYEIDHAAIARLEVNAFRRAWRQQVAAEKKSQEAKAAKKAEKAARPRRRKILGIF